MKWPFLLAVAMLSFGALSGCPQATQSVGGGGPASGDTSFTEPPPVVAATETPIDPKNDPKGIGRDKKEEVDPGTEEDERIPVTEEMLGFGRLKPTPFIDARLRYGKDSQILAKSPETGYVILGKSTKLTVTFLLEMNWDPALTDSYWMTLTDSYENKPQLRVVSIPSAASAQVFYCDAAWAPDGSGNVVYSFTDLPVTDGGELRFFLKEAKSTDYHVGSLVPLTSNDPAKPFPADAEGTVYSLGVFRLKSVVFSPEPGPARQNEGPSLPLKL